MEGYKPQDFSFLHLSEKLVQQEWPIRDIGFGVMDATNIRVFFLLKRVSNMKPKVSIIVPVYNVENYLDRCMESLINQTLKEIEIILVDDGSLDNCPQMCDDYAKKDSRVKVVHKQNAGLGHARNSGLDLSTGEYVAFVDSDDFVSLNTYEYCYNLATKEKLDVVRFDMKRFTNKYSISSIDGDKEPIICRDVQMLKKLSLAFWGNMIGVEKITFVNVPVGSSCCGLYNRSFLMHNNIIFKSEREYLSEDFEFNYRVLQRTSAVGFIQTRFYHYFKNPQSLTTTVRTDKVDRAIDFSKKMTQEMLNDGYSSFESEIHPMGYSISILRDVQKLVFLSNMPLAEKKKWFYEQRQKEYLKEIRKRYPLSIICLKHRLSFMLTMGGYFYLSYLLVKIKGR